MKIIHRLILCGLIWGLIFKIWGNGYQGILYFILNTTIPVVLLFLLFQMRALGAGDIKLFSLVGSFMTTKQLIQVILFSFIFAAILGMGKVLCLHFTGAGKKESVTKIHFSLEILLAVVYVTGRCIVAKN